MRYAILSDIHSNLEAFGSVLAAIDGKDVDEIVCLGDLVGYNADPDACIKLVKERSVKCVMGNHDSRVSGIDEPGDFNPLAESAIYWTLQNISKESIDFLKKLPRKLYINGATLAIHGWIDDTDRYIASLYDAGVNFEMMEEESRGPMLCFFGHTHVQAVYSIFKDNLSIEVGNEIVLVEGKSYLINPGSVGQPRDLDYRTSFAIYDSEKGKVEFFREDYDVEATCRKIIDSGLPPEFAERLKVGY